MRLKTKRLSMLCLVFLLCFNQPIRAEDRVSVVDDKSAADQRLGDLRNLNGYFPMQAVQSPDQWPARRAEIRKRILVSQGLWPMPTKTDLRAVIHGRVDREDYVVDRVYFESAPGHFVSGSLYRPKGQSVNQRPMPAILSPHGHWNDGRMYDAGEPAVQQQIEIGAEADPVGGRHPIQARAVQLARMGCIVFSYDMTGVADSVQLGHRPNKWSHLDQSENWGFFSTQAELRLQNMMGLQTWNSIRALDFLLSLDEVDPARVGVTGASGGGTQAMIIAAIDDRITAAMPCVMVSTAMQGGCTCENAPLMRINQGNIDIAAAFAPRPLGLTAADDWTVELQTKGYPELRALYEMLGAAENLTAVFHTRFKHNYNLVNRLAMYDFFNRHFKLGVEEIRERPFQPLSKSEATVWNDQHPAPAGDQVGDAHEVALLAMVTEDSDARINALLPKSTEQFETFRDVVGSAWNVILDRRFDDVGEVVFSEANRSDDSGSVVVTGTLSDLDANQRIPMVQIHPNDKTKTKGLVVWIDDVGISGVISNEGPSAKVGSLIAAGYEVISADLFGQGEFLKLGLPADSQRMWYQGNGGDSWQGFAGYTYGYNHCLFAQRMHDVLSLLKYAHTEAAKQGLSKADINLVGLGPTAGPLALAATAQLGDVSDSPIARTLADLNGFRFESLTRHDDPMFVPGAVKYLDVDGLMALSAPHQLWVNRDAISETAKGVYRASGKSDAIRGFESRQDITKILSGELM